MNYKISETLTLELHIDDDPHLLLSRKDGATLRIEMNETWPLLSSVQEAFGFLLRALLAEDGIALVQIRGEGKDAGFVLPVPCNRCGVGVVFANRTEDEEWAFRCDNCGQTWKSQTVTIDGSGWTD